MKNQAQTVLLGMITLMTMFSCQEEDNPMIPSNPETVENILLTGDWEITLFIDSGNEETNHFNGYTFDFQDNGSLVAQNGLMTREGIWNITTDNSGDDDDQSDLDFNIQFGGNDDFEELDDDWDIVSQSNTKIELIDISGGNGGTDFLTFEKN